MPLYPAFYAKAGRGTLRPGAVREVASREHGGGREDHLEGGRGEAGYVLPQGKDGGASRQRYIIYIVCPYPAYPARAERGPFRPEGVYWDFGDTHFTEKLGSAKGWS